MKIPRTVVFALALLVSGSAFAQAPERPDVKFALDFAFQGMHMFFTRAVDGGHYKREGLNVTLDRGYGSQDTITKVAAKAYDFGFADVNPLVKFNGQRPDSRVICVFQAFDRSLTAAISLRSNGVNKPADLAGKTFAGSDGEGSRLLFPIFARKVGIDVSTVKWKTVAQNLREAMLVKKQADAITGFVSTTFFNLKAAGVDPNDIIAFPYADYGLELYGNGIVVREDFAAQNPATVAAFVRGTIAGMLDVMKDPAGGMASLKKRDALLNESLEMDRYKMILERAILTPGVRKNGLGAIDKARLDETIKFVADAFGVKTPPSADQVATERFLPPRERRMAPF